MEEFFKINTMKKIKFLHKIILIGCLFISYEGISQQIPIFHQYNYQPALYNPAALGMNEGFMGIQYRQEWLNLDKSDAPNTYMFGADLSEPFNLTDKNIGLGFSILSDKTHIVQKNQFKASFAYHLINSDLHGFSAGVQAGFLSGRLNFGESLISDPSDIVLFSNAQNTGIFDGGLGLHYQFDNQHNQKFQINVSLPQLFTSDLNYENGNRLGSTTHLLAGMSYRINFGNVGIEPAFLYREFIGTEQLKSGHLDANLRLYFMDDLLSIGGGYRTGAEVYNAQIGLHIAQKIQVIGVFEAGHPFGSTLELGAYYTFGEAGGNGKSGLSPEHATQLNEAKIQASVATQNLETLSPETEEYLNLATFAFEKAQLDTRNKTAMRAEIKTTQQYLELVQKSLLKVGTEVNSVKDAKQNAEVIEWEATKQKQITKSARKTVQLIKDQLIAANEVQINLNNNYQVFKIEVDNFIEKHQLEAPQVKDLIQSNDLLALQNYYQEKWRELPNKPNSMPAPTVSKEGNSFYLSYQFPNTVEAYNLETSLPKVRQLADHINANLEEINAEGVKIGNIQLFATMRGDKSGLQFGAEASYQGEYGTPLNLRFSWYDAAQRSRSFQNAMISNGALSLEQVVLLKLQGLQNHFLKNNTYVAAEQVSLELSTSHFGQEFSEVYWVRIEVKNR